MSDVVVVDAPSTVVVHETATAVLAVPAVAVPPVETTTTGPATVVREAEYDVLAVPGPAASTVGVATPGPPGPPGPPGTSEPTSYTHTQALPETEWSVNHQLGFVPSVLIVDTAGHVGVGDIEVIDADTVVLRFAAAFAGTAYLS